jgi:tetratricopeptide (TPR) repeat protein
VIVVAALLITAVAPAAADPCAFDSNSASQAPTGHDAEAAALYRQIGDEEREAGDSAAATFAYREALRRSPRDQRARSALARLCVDARRTRGANSAADTAADSLGLRFDEGLRLMERGDRKGAIAAFEAVRSSTSDPSAALLEGICEYERGHDRRARTLLLEAKMEPEIAGTAQFFLGIIALRAGDSAEASSLLASARALDPRLATNASDVLRLARRDGRLVLSAFTEGGFDSNVELTPDGTITGGGSADGYGLAAIALFARPYGISGPYFRANAQYREQARITAYNLADVAGALGVRASRDGGSVVAEYAYDFIALGQSPFLSAHRLLGGGRLPLGAFSFAATYFARFESFLSAGISGYSGLRHDVEAQSDWRPGRRSTVLVGYHLGRDATKDAALGYLEHGPLAGFRLGLDRPIRFGVEGRLTLRRYGAVDPDLGVERADRYVDGAVSGELDLSEHWTVRIVGTARRALSNIADFQYTKVTASVGLVYAVGVL